jgi:hypothetical protein
MSATAEPQDWPIAPAPPPRRRGRRPGWLLPTVAGVLAAALVAGLLVWQPWSPRPVAPASLTASSPTGTTVRLSWPAARGGATPSQYVILRDGTQVAEVAGDQTSWTNTGLRPGDNFRYAVATRGGGWQSGPSPAAAATVLAPSPVALKVASTYTTATLTWRPSPLGPAPDKYLVYDGPDLKATLDGSVTSYHESGLLQGAPFYYSVVAEWGTFESARSPTDSGTIRSAPLNALQDVNVTLTGQPSGAIGGTIGKVFPTSWNFTPQCSTSACTMTVNVNVPSSDQGAIPLTVKVTRSGADYSGTTQAKFVKCGSDVTTDTITLTLVPDTRQISNGRWGRWTATVSAAAPYVNLDNGYYCPAGTWNFSASSGGAGAPASSTV